MRWWLGHSSGAQQQHQYPCARLSILARHYIHASQYPCAPVHHHVAMAILHTTNNLLEKMTRLILWQPPLFNNVVKQLTTCGKQSMKGVCVCVRGRLRRRRGGQQQQHCMRPLCSAQLIAVASVCTVQCGGPKGPKGPLPPPDIVAAQYLLSHLGRTP